MVFFILISISACTIRARIESLDSGASQSEGYIPDSPSVTQTPSPPSSLVLKSPLLSPGGSANPIITVAGVTSGDTVKLYSDSSCSVQVGSAAAINSSVDISVSLSAPGTYSYYATRTNGIGRSACSTATVSYIYDSTRTLVFTVQPSNTPQNQPIKPTITVEVRDINNRLVITGSYTVTLAIQTDPSGKNAVLTGTRTAISVSGVARFPEVTIDEAANGYILTVSATGLVSANSSSFNITSGPTMIYRSIGQNSNAIHSGNASNKITVVGDILTFEADPGYSATLGNAIQYDANNDGTVDSIAFFYKKLPLNKFKIKNAAGGTPAATTAADADWSTFYSYYSLVDAESGTNETLGINAALRDFDTWSGGKDIVASNEIWVLVGQQSNSALTHVVIDGWTTSASNYIKLYTTRDESTEGSNTFRQFEFSRSTNPSLLDIRDDFVRVDGFNFYQFASMTGNQSAITVSTTTGEVQISNCHFSAAYSSSYTGTNNFYLSITSGDAKVWNNIFSMNLVNTNIKNYDANINFNSPGKTGWIYNNSINYSLASGHTGIQRQAGTVVLKNNIVQNCADGYSGTFDAASTANASDIVGDPPGTNATLVTDIYTSSNMCTEKCMMIAFNGANLSADPNLAFDMDSDLKPRQVFWSIGPTQEPTGLFRSIGFNSTAELDSGAGSKSLTVANSIATFSASTNGSVGDVIEYSGVNGSTLAFIYHRESSTVYRILNAAMGSADSTSTPDLNWSIRRSYTSITDAIALEENSGISSALRNFDSSIKSNAIATTFFAYADRVYSESPTLDDWTWFRLYVPFWDRHVATSQRHSGIWENTKTTLQGQLTAKSKLILEGFQLTPPNGQYSILYDGKVGDTFTGEGSTIQRNIFKATDLTNPLGAISHVNATELHAYIFNNLFYDFRNGSGNSGVFNINNSSDLGNVYFFNNTVFNCDVGIKTLGYIEISNNIVQKCTDGYQMTPIYGSYNISDLAADATGTGSQNSVSVEFEDVAAENFFLSPKDKIARHKGTAASSQDLALRTRFNRITNIGALQGPIVKYRSLGSNSAAIATSGGSMTLTVSNNVATFSGGGPGNNVGVGDVVQYTATPIIAFIAERVSATQFRLVSANDTKVLNQTATTSWDIYRAYTTTANANALDENDSLNNAVEDFDSSYDLSRATGQDAILFVNLYKDGAGGLTGHWGASYSATTDRTNYIYFNVPSASTEVGATQKHTGISGTGYTWNLTDNLFSISGATVFDGLEVNLTTTVNSLFYGLLPTSAIAVKNCLIKHTGVSILARGLSESNLSKFVAANNIISGFASAIRVGNAGQRILYNNTIYNSDIAIATYDSAANPVISPVVINNPVIGCATRCFDNAIAYDSRSGNNVASDNTSPGTNNYQTSQLATTLFENISLDDFHIGDSSSDLINRGLDMTSDTVWRFNKDIDLQTRPSGVWDVGADQL